MKKLVLVPFLLFAFISTISAQGGDRMFKKFKGEFSLGYSNFSGNTNFKNGFLIAFEPKFQLLDQLAIGGRIETIISGKASSNDNFATLAGDVDLKIYESFLATGEYYFTKNYNARPFVGGGAGIYALATAYSGETNTRTLARFGGMIRVGIEIKHLRLGVEYNLVPTTTSIENFYNQTTFNYEDVRVESKNNYFSIKVGFCFGGGPINR